MGRQTHTLAFLAIDRIVAKVDELMALCDTLETNLKTTTTLTTHLLDALLAQALEVGEIQQPELVT